MARMNFNASAVQPASAFDPLPAGWYTARIIQSEIRPTSKQDGHYIYLSLQVAEGEHSGRLIFDRLNIDNPNPKAVEIAYASLSAICHATEVIDMQDTEQLHGIPLEVKVSISPANGQYPASNDVKGYRSLQKSGAATWAPPSAAAAPSQPQAPAPQPPVSAPTPPPMAWATPPQPQPAAPAWAKPQSTAPAAQPQPQPQPATQVQPAAPAWTPPKAAPSAGAAPGTPPWAR